EAEELKSSFQTQQDRKLWVKLPSEVLAMLLGCDEDTRMLLLKPCYGQLDAPRGWHLKAVDRLLKRGCCQHPLDPCCFMVFEPDFPDIKTNPDSKVLEKTRLCGMVIIQVDANCLEYCGASRSRMPTGGWTPNHKKHLEKVRPITTRDLQAMLPEKEISQL
ncbi:unnamed protein product, partial [Effrenium voratum]